MAILPADRTETDFKEPNREASEEGFQEEPIANTDAAKTTAAAAAVAEEVLTPFLPANDTIRSRHCMRLKPTQKI